MTYEIHKDCTSGEEAAVAIGELYDWLGALTLKDVAKGAKLDVMITLKT